MSADPIPLDPEAVLAHAPWVRQLARRLVAGGTLAADDLAQEAWVRALENPPPRGLALRAWLAGILRNAARDHRRGEARRRRREASAARLQAPEPFPTDSDLRERIAREQALVRLVLGLDQPYRRTVLLRYSEGLGPRAIAAREGVSPETVRTRLRRALAELRRRADRESGLCGAGWMAALAAAPAPSPATLPFLGAVLLMKVQVALVAAAFVLALAGGWWFLGRSGPAVPEKDRFVPAPARALESTAQALEGASSAPVEGGVREVRVAAGAAAEPSTEAPPTALVVQVVGPEGMPVAGVDVGLLATKRELWRATTRESDGCAVLEDFEARFPLREGEREERTVAVVSPLRTPVAAPLMTHDWKAGPIVLRLGEATGSLALELVDEAGAAFPIEQWVQVTPLVPRAGEPESKGRGERHGRYLRNESRETFHGVGLGLRFLVGVEPGGVVKGVEVEVDGPTRAGESARVELVLGARHPSFVGRLVDAGGSPYVPPWLYADAECVAVDGAPVARRDRRAGRAGVEASGRFVLPIERGFPAGTRLSMRLSTPEQQGGSPSLTGTFEQVVPSGDAAVEVGDVVVLPPPLLASGLVRDAAGHPVPGATIALFEKFNQGEDPEDFGWNFAGLDYTYSDDTGAFEVRSDLPPAEYALRAQMRGYADRGVLRFEHGARGLVCVLDAACTLSTRMEVDPSIPLDRLSVELTYPGAGREATSYARWSARPDPRGRIDFEDLRPGDASLVVRTGHYAQPLIEVRDLALEAGRPCADPRLAPLDLRGKLRLVSLEVVDASRAPVERGVADLGGVRYALDGGRLSVLRRNEPLELSLECPGFLPRASRAPDVHERLVLERGIPVTIRAPRALPPAPDPMQLRVGLRPREHSARSGQILTQDEDSIAYSEGLTTEHELVRIDGRDQVTVHVARPGEYYLSWLLVDLGDPYRGGGYEWVSPEHTRVEVLASGPQPILEASPDLEDYARKLEAR